MQNNIPQELKVASGIYEIRNLLNNKVYIGSTNNFYTRFKTHKSSLNRQKHNNAKLLNSARKYGISSFSFSVLQIINKIDGESTKDFTTRLLAAEYDFIASLKANTSTNGYNIRIDPDTNVGAKLSSKAIRQPLAPNALFGSNNYRAILNEGVAKEIKLMIAKGLPSAGIARHFNINSPIVYQIKRGKLWKQITITNEEINNYQPPLNIIKIKPGSVVGTKRAKMTLRHDTKLTEVSIIEIATHLKTV